MVTPAEFEKAVKDLGIGKYHGPYRGRHHHNGYAVTFKERDDVAAMMVRLQQVDGLSELMEEMPHMDTFGHGVIASWDESLFSK